MDYRKTIEISSSCVLEVVISEGGYNSCWLDVEDNPEPGSRSCTDTFLIEIETAKQLIKALQKFVESEGE